MESNPSQHPEIVPVVKLISLKINAERFIPDAAGLERRRGTLWIQGRKFPPNHQIWQQRKTQIDCLNELNTHAHTCACTHSRVLDLMSLLPTHTFCLINPHQTGTHLNIHLGVGRRLTGLSLFLLAALSLCRCINNSPCLSTTQSWSFFPSDKVSRSFYKLIRVCSLWSRQLWTQRIDLAGESTVPDHDFKQNPGLLWRGQPGPEQYPHWWPVRWPVRCVWGEGGGQEVRPCAEDPAMKLGRKISRMGSWIICGTSWKLADEEFFSLLVKKRRRKTFCFYLTYLTASNETSVTHQWVLFKHSNKL